MLAELPAAAVLPDVPREGVTLSATILAGAGNDKIDGGSEADRILGGDGNDIITGGDGRDTIYGQNWR